MLVCVKKIIRLIGEENLINERVICAFFLRIIYGALVQVHTENMADFT